MTNAQIHHFRDFKFCDSHFHYTFPETLDTMTDIMGQFRNYFSLERMGLMAQSVIYFVFTSAVWVPVACFCWGFHKYSLSVLGVSTSYVISYVICWGIHYYKCRKNVEQINNKLKEMRR